MAEPVLVAETDENQKIIAVWIAGDGRRHPAPARRSEVAQVLKRAKVSGAPKTTISAWAAAQDGA